MKIRKSYVQEKYVVENIASEIIEFAKEMASKGYIYRGRQYINHGMNTEMTFEKIIEVNHSNKL